MYAKIFTHYKSTFLYTQIYIQCKQTYFIPFPFKLADHVHYYASSIAVVILHEMLSLVINIKAYAVVIYGGIPIIPLLWLRIHL